MVKAGARKRIENGRDTAICNVPWLPDVTNGYVRTLMHVQLQNSTVHNLMQEDGCNWDFDIIQDVFQDRDAELVKRIPLQLSDATDSWFWILDEKGDYKIKSGYRWLQWEMCTIEKWYWTNGR